MAFFTQKQVAEYVTSKIPGIKCVHLPEGLEQNGYSKGLSLKERNIDLLEMGRLYPKLHFELLRIQDLSLIHLYQKGPELLFPTFEDLSKALSDTKISFCFPRCDTHIEHAGSVETLTQRYWECMYSRTLILGRAPKELVDLLGYNPVIDINWDNVGLQILGILGNIEKYQPLVDRNYEYAVEFATWKSRIPFIEEVLSKYLDDEKK